MTDIIPNVDLTDTAAVLAAGYVEFNYELKPTPDSNYTKEWTAGSDTEVSSGVWKNNWSLTDRTMTDAERADAILRGMNELRRERDKRLKLTDHFGLEDTSSMSDELKTYRQALRDLPAGTSDPFNVTWPTAPSGVKTETFE